MTAGPELDFQPPDALQPVLTGLRERFEAGAIDLDPDDDDDDFDVPSFLR